jgi:hypothetical protein
LALLARDRDVHAVAARLSTAELERLREVVELELAYRRPAAEGG